MTLYKELTDKFLEVRTTFPEAIWDEKTHSFIDENLAKVARDVYPNADELRLLDVPEYESKINSNLQNLYSDNGLEIIADNFSLVGMLLALDFEYPIINIFGMALADGDSAKISEVWNHCLNGIQYEFSKSLSVDPNKENTLRLAQLLDLIHEFQSIMIDLEFFSSNYIPLVGLDYWFGDLSKRVDKFLTHEDIIFLSEKSGTPTLVSMHSSVPEPSWLAKQFEIGTSFLANNPNLPAEIVNTTVQLKQWGLSDKLLLHPNVDEKFAIEWALEMLDSGEGEDLCDALREWDNVRDDGFNNYNSFRATSNSGKKVLAAIKKWCKGNPDEGE
jgi:hypothetical protein